MILLKDGDNEALVRFEEVRYVSHEDPHFIVCRGTIWEESYERDSNNYFDWYYSKIRDLTPMEILVEAIDYRGQIRKFQR